MNVLATAASRHGATTENAAAIAHDLRLRGLDAGRVDPDHVDHVVAYDAVALGSAVYAGSWLRPATSLVDRCATQVARRPLWLFNSGPIGRPSEPAGGPEVADILVRTLAGDHHAFASKLDKSELGLLERTMVRVVHAAEGDDRDRGDINAWTSRIADALVAGEPEQSTSQSHGR
jgi:menaquinone-dependent protoporphyrinogen oxidase